jgi:hypothetical protein
LRKLGGNEIKQKSKVTTRRWKGKGRKREKGEEGD